MAETVPLAVGKTAIELHYISVLTQPSAPPLDDVYGVLGIDALDQLKSYTFDYRTMRFSAEGRVKTEQRSPDFNFLSAYCLQPLFLLFLRFASGRGARRRATATPNSQQHQSPPQIRIDPKALCINRRIVARAKPNAARIVPINVNIIPIVMRAS